MEKRMNGNIKRQTVIGFISLIVVQLAVFYILPLAAGPTDTMGLVILMLWLTLVMSFLAGLFYQRIKYCYPVIVSVVFAPTIFMYYNSTATVHILWYFVSSLAGVLAGSLFRFVVRFFSG